MVEVHLNVRRLALIFLLTTGVPLVIGVTIDLLVGTAPFATIVVGLISIPLASIIVGRVILAEFDLMIERIAPVGPDSPYDDLSSGYDGVQFVGAAEKAQ